jgi:hypothetical protein
VWFTRDVISEPRLAKWREDTNQTNLQTAATQGTAEE